MLTDIPVLTVCSCVLHCLQDIPARTEYIDAGRWVLCSLQFVAPTLLGGVHVAPTLLGAIYVASKLRMLGVVHVQPLPHHSAVRWHDDRGT